MKNKIYNTPEYRNSKRVVGFIDKVLKKKIVKLAKKKNISISKALGIIIASYFFE